MTICCEIQFSHDKSKAWLGQPHLLKKLSKTFEEEVSKLPKYKTPGTPSFQVMRPEEQPLVPMNGQVLHRLQTSS